MEAESIGISASGEAEGVVPRLGMVGDGDSCEA